VDAEIAAAVARFETAGPPDPLVMFDHAYGAPPLQLEAQRAEVAARLAAAAPAPAGAAAPAPPASVPMRGQRTTRR
jgi:predicted alpha/beta hydrolase